jgi:hypothetical protein
LRLPFLLKAFQMPASIRRWLDWVITFCSGKKQLSEPTKKAMRGMRPRMAFVSLAVVTGGN